MEMDKLQSAGKDAVLPEKFLAELSLVGETAGIALSEEGRLLTELCWHTGQNHTIQLVPNIDSILKLNRADMSSVKAVFVARGPGSFNGLRVGVSAAKGFAFALDVPLVSIDTLEIEAYAFAFSGLPVCAIHGAGRGEIAAATDRAAS